MATAAVVQKQASVISNVNDSSSESEGSRSIFSSPSKMRSPSSGSSWGASSTSPSSFSPGFNPGSQHISCTNSSIVSVNAPFGENNAQSAAGGVPTSSYTWSSVNANGSLSGGLTSSRSDNSNPWTLASLDTRQRQEPTSNELVSWGSSRNSQSPNQNEPASDWGVPGSMGAGSGLSINGAGWGSQAGSSQQQPSSMSDITNLTKANAAGSSSSAAATVTNSVWQNDSGDSNKNSWNTSQAQAMNPKNGLLNPGSQNNSNPAQQGLASGMDQENMPVLPTVPTERTPLDDMIYRKGWGQVEVKQDIPWAVPQTPPPVNDDPSVWKPKANTGTEVWEKSTGHRTQQWQPQAPDTPLWMSGGERENQSVWSGGGPSISAQMSAPGSTGGMMSLSGVANGNSGIGVLSSGGGINGGGSRGRAGWDGGAGSGGSGGSSGGNISPTNQWAEDQEWSEWRDPNSRGKPDVDDGTSHWSHNGGGPPARPANAYGPSAMGGMPDPRKQPADLGYQQKQRGWADSNQFGGPPQPRSNAEWENNDWQRAAEPDKNPQWGSSGREQQQKPQRSFSPPNGQAKYTQEQIYSSKQYRGLLEMGFKREDIDVVMRNCNMNYEATVAELQQRRRQQQMQSANFPGVDNLRGGGMSGLGSASNVPGSMANKSARAPDNIQAMARQLSVAAGQGIINPRLLSQPLAPQTTYLLHKLMHSHRQLQNMLVHHQNMSSLKSMNPMQQQQLQNLIAHIQQLKKEITGYQKQIDAVQNDFMKSPNESRFQGGPTLVDLADSMDWTKTTGFTNPPVPMNQGYNQQPANTSFNAAPWRMPNDPNMYSSMGAGDSWGNMGNPMMGAGSTYGTAGPMPGAAMWNEGGFGGGMGGGSVAHAGMAFRPSGPGDDWAGGHQMKMSQGGGLGMYSGVIDPLSPTRGHANSNGYGMDESDGSNWGSNRQMESSMSTFNNSRFSTLDSLPEFEPGKPWRGSQLLSADDDPHLTPGSVAKSPLG